MKRLIVYYDGYCVFCNFWVRKLCQWDRNEGIRFAALDSHSAVQMMEVSGFDISTVDALICWNQKSAPQTASAAVFMICRKLGGVFRLVTLIEVLPYSILNRIYKVIASNRYQWFGKLGTCPLPEAEYRHKFL